MSSTDNLRAPRASTTGTDAAIDAVLAIKPLGFPWATSDPFLFCVHHDDAYPAGNEQMGPHASLVGRNIGQDFEGKDGWRMYHGQTVPGFPQHPHRGFETVTIVRKGLIDHADSLGAKARFGRGDVQWVTAGRGIVHSEMFPLLDRERPNPLELFQIWLNLPAADKMSDPHFTMLWRHDIPIVTSHDSHGRATEVTVVAGTRGDVHAPPPPPHSWAARNDADVAIWTIKMAPGARFVLEPTARDTNRTLYFFRGQDLQVSGNAVPVKSGVAVRPDVAITMINGETESELLLLQGRPIAEPVAQHGPFVMNSGAEIQQAVNDFRRTQFGGWPWPSDDPVHGRTEGRFAVHTDGRVEKADEDG
jgi:redox-sensitive bicupin YhaK (pirin superfamily)